MVRYLPRTPFQFIPKYPSKTAPVLAANTFRRRACLRRSQNLRLIQRHLRPRHRSQVRTLVNTYGEGIKKLYICGMVHRLTFWVIPVAAKPSPVSPVA
jgi:hypothetical protein